MDNGSGVARVPAARADLKFAAPRDFFCLIPQKFFDDLFFSQPPVFLHFIPLKRFLFPKIFFHPLKIFFAPP